MTYSQDDLISDIRQLRKNGEYKVKTGKPGIGLHRLYKEISQRISTEQLIALLTKLRAQGTIIILAKEGFVQGRGSPLVVEQSLDTTLFDYQDGCWAQKTQTGELNLRELLVYITADGLPSALAKQGFVKRALERIKM